jgi:phenylpropionate dioxygenase-like ring-hydroxylating dioxygenase large terminal subunit
VAIAEESRTQARRPPPPRRLLDPRAYTDPDRLRLEFERMWSKVWQLACLDSDVPQPGDWYEYVIGQWSIIVVRQPDRSLKAFHNVCAHRGRRMKTGCGNSDQIQCPYHLWTWNLEGRLQHVPERSTYCEFADEDAALQEVRVDQWQHWIFVNLDPGAGSLMECLGELPDVLAPYRLDRMYKWHSTSTRSRSNWKAVADAFNEAYHARAIHPESISFINYTDYEIRLHGDHSMMLIPFGMPDVESVPMVPDYQEMMDAMEFSFAAFGEDTALVEFLRMCHLEPGQQLRELMVPLMRGGMAQSGIDVSELDDSQLVDDWHFHFFPNVIINQFSFGYWMFRILPDPVDPNSSTIDMWYFHRVPDGQELPSPAEHRVIPEGETCGAVMDQDLRNLPVQQLGLLSPAAPGHRLSSLEARIVHMHDVLDRYLNGVS